jgi:hypothetical protein
MEIVFVELVLNILMKFVTKFVAMDYLFIIIVMMVIQLMEMVVQMFAISKQIINAVEVV